MSDDYEEIGGVSSEARQEISIETDRTLNSINGKRRTLVQYALDSVPPKDPGLRENFVARRL